MKYIQPNRFKNFIIVGIMAAFLVSCKKGDSSENKAPLPPPLVTSVDIEQTQSSTLLTRSSLLFDYSGNDLIKVHNYQNGTEIGYMQFQYGTGDQISSIEHHTLNAYSGYVTTGSNRNPDLLNSREDFTYNQAGNLDTYSTRSYFFGNGLTAPPNEYTGDKESYTYNADGSVSVRVFTLFSTTGNSAAEKVTEFGSKVISFPSAGVKKVIFTNNAAKTTVTYTFNYDSKNNPFKNITGTFQKLWVTPVYGVKSYDNGILEDSGALGDIFSANNLLNYTGDDNSAGHFGYTYNAGNYPTSVSGLNFTTLTYHYNQ